MLTFIWLAFTTLIGYAIGHFWVTDYVLLCTFIGFAIGLILRFFGRNADDVADIVGDALD